MICECGKHAWASLTKGYVAVVSPEDESFLESFKWYASTIGRRYITVRRNSARKKQYLAREIVTPDTGYVVDHIDGNTLNNTRDNLRVCLPTQNAINARQRRGKAVPLKGVRKGANGKFQAMISHAKRQYYLGTFETAEAAHAAYTAKAEMLHGEFMRREGEQ
ncbi:hypothetical protein GGE68_001418 [Rhizobium leguminosarum]|uniref:HNH endonuclease n=1 Tax=Rhizobium leguminosarum TaxID=384 RepID=UPI0016080B91|nr:HNH endonuclease [Rhizobium leguminosarum]MBB5663242.1 hypothetical protein [Rhizobium leguminosarum]